MLFFFSSRRRHTRWPRDWSSDVCSSDLRDLAVVLVFICPETVHYLKTLRPILKEKIVKAAEGFESFKVLSKIGRASCREREWVRVVEGFKAENGETVNNTW